MGGYLKVLKYYSFALFIHPSFSAALNNIAIIYYYQDIKAAEKGCSKSLFQKAAFY